MNDLKTMAELNARKTDFEARRLIERKAAPSSCCNAAVIMRRKCGPTGCGRSPVCQKCGKVQ